MYFIDVIRIDTYHALFIFLESHVIKLFFLKHTFCLTKEVIRVKLLTYEISYDRYLQIMLSFKKIFFTYTSKHFNFK